MKAVEDQIVPPLEIEVNYARIEAPSQAHREIPAHPKTCGRRGTNILSSQLGHMLGKELWPGPRTQSRLFPGIAWSRQQTSRVQTQAVAHNQLSGMLPPRSPAWSWARPASGPRQCLSTVWGSAEASDYPNVAGRQLDTGQSVPVGKGALERLVPALHWAAIYLCRHSHWARNINSCV